MDNRNKIEINLKNSINTDTINEDYKQFDDPTAPLIENTGIERDGGVTNIYQKQVDYPEAGQYVVTQDDKILSVVASSTTDYKIVKVNGKAIGQVSAYGVEDTIEVAGVNDIFLDTSSYTTCSLVDNVITVTEYSYAGVQLNTRNITFTNLGPILTFFTSLSFVRWEGMKYSDSLEWSIRLADQVIILQESNPGITVVKALQSTNVLGTNNIYASVVYNNQFIVAGAGGRLGSFDGNNWKNYDGSGTGVGISNNGNATSGVIGSNDILSMVVYSYGGANFLVVGGNGGRIGSYNGTSWNKWDSGAAISNNSTVISTDNVTTMTTFEGQLVVAGSAGKLGSWSGTAWTNYNAAGLSDNATLIGAVSINATITYSDTTNDVDGIKKFVEAGASGRMGNMQQDWIALSAGAAPMGTTSNISSYVNLDNNRIFFNNSAGGYMYSDNGGQTWTTGTLAGFVSGSVGTPFKFDNKWFISNSSGTAGYYYSTDNGTTWSTKIACPGSTTVIYKFSDNFISCWKLSGTGENTFYTSTDGINWTLKTIPYTFTYFVYPYAMYQNTIIIADSNGTTSYTQYVYSSNDGGDTWLKTDTGAGGVDTWNIFDYKNNFILSYSQKYKVYNYINNTFGTEQNIPGGVSTSLLVKLYADDNIYFAYSYVGTAIYLFKSTDSGVTWTKIYENSSWGTAFTGNGFNYYNNIIYLTSFNGNKQVLSNDGGINWISTTNTFGLLYKVNNKNILIARSSSVTTSVYFSYDSGQSWTSAIATGVTNTFGFIGYFNGVVYGFNNGATAGQIVKSVIGSNTFSLQTVSGWTSFYYGGSQRPVPVIINGVYYFVLWDQYRVSYTSFTTYTKTLYTAAGTGTSILANNGTVIGANTINALAQYNTGAKSPYLPTSFNFNNVPSVTASGWICMAYGDGVWIAVAYANATSQGIYRSTDGGVNWSIATVSTPGSNWQSVAYGNGVWVAVASTTSTTAGIARSTDGGLNWTFTTTTAPGSPGWISVAYGNGVWVAVAATTSTTAGIARSTDDGVSWAFQTTTAPAGNWTSVAYGGGTFVAIAQTASTTAGIATSPTGVTWTFRTTTAPASGWNHISYGDGVFIAVASTNSAAAAVARSTDSGATWGFITMTPIASFGSWKKAAYGGSIWVITHSAGTSNVNGTYYSTNGGLNWTFIATEIPAGLGWQGTAYGDNKFISYALRTGGIGPVVTATNNMATSYNNSSALSLIVGGNGGRIGSFNSGAWANYSSDTGVFVDDGTNIGSVSISAMTVYNNTLVYAGGSGRLASMDTTTKYPYNGGVGLANNGTIIGNNTIYSLVEYQTNLIVSGATSVVNSMSSTGGFTPFYNAGGTPVSNLLTGFNSLGYVYTYRYENGLYLINLVGNSLDKSYTLNNSTKDINILTARYCVPQVQSGKTRHITSADDKGYARIYDASNIKATGLVGYTDFINYSGTIVYPAAPYTLGNGNVLLSQAGWGYTDFTFRLSSSATNVYNHIPQFQANTSGLYQVVQSNSNILINAYGKLTNNVGVIPSKPFEFRAGWTSGVQSFFSAALLDGFATDSMGVLITNVGEIDDTYQPFIKDDDKILYFYNNKFIIKKIGTGITDYIQNVSKNIYKINTLSPLNIIDSDTETLEIGSIDYNNRMLFYSSVAPTTSTKIVTFIQGKYANSIDTGDKLVTIVSPTTANIEVIGYRIPVVATSVGSYSADTYIQDLYSFSTLNDGSELIVGAKQDTIYASTTILPLAQGLEYNNGTVASGGSTIFLKPDYDGYSIGNDIAGVYDSFTLFGQLYLYDQNSIYAASVDPTTGIFDSKTLLTSAPGLKYIATAPTEIYFLSEFDNSIFKFNGGRTLDKFKRLNQLSAVNSGIYNTRDNTLILDTDDSFIWVRDSIITQNDKLASQTNLKYYDTEDGIIISNNTSNWNYTYIPLQGSTVVPLGIQTPYFGFDINDKSILSSWVITIYNKNKTRVELNGQLYTIDEDVSNTQSVSWVINPKDYNDGGYARVRVQPKYQRTLGTSLKLSTDDKIILISVIAEFTKGEAAVVAAQRSR